MSSVANMSIEEKVAIVCLYFSRLKSDDERYKGVCHPVLKKLAEKLSEIHGKNYSYNSLLGKLNRESLSLKEAITIAEILNYKLEFIDNYK